MTDHPDGIIRILEGQLAKARSELAGQTERLAACRQTAATLKDALVEAIEALEAELGFDDDDLPHPRVVRLRAIVVNADPPPRER